MSLEQSKSLARRFNEEVFNQGNLSVVDEICSPDYINHSAPPGIPSGSNGTKMFVSMFRAAFPDVHISVEDMIAEGDKVVVRWTVHGTHTGTFLNIPPTGKTITLPGIDIMRVSDGKVTDHWDGVDQTILLRQLGVMP